MTFRTGILALATIFATACAGRSRSGVDPLPLAYGVELPPGVDPASIRWDLPSAGFLEIDRAGNLLIHNDSGQTRRAHPRVSQDADTGRRSLPARFVLDASGEVRVTVESYDRRFPVRIEPFSPFLTAGER